MYFTDRNDREKVLLWLLENTDKVPMEISSLISDIIRDVEYYNEKYKEYLTFGIKWLNRLEDFVERRKKNNG